MALRLVSLSYLVGATAGLGQSFLATKPTPHGQSGDSQQLYCPSGHEDYNLDYGDNVEIDAVSCSKLRFGR